MNDTIIKEIMGKDKEGSLLKGGAGAGLIKTSKIMGKDHLYTMMVKIGWGYRKRFFIKKLRKKQINLLIE